ncbi:MAG: 4Fe-4S dicluster domain-containing protein [Acidobacteria bacterium]|nr:4Fe-4S dicluster domain-containing protein [Acidobacteriota bacterium]
MKKDDSPNQGLLAAQDDKILACVHCGLCLEACPTYLATGDENDSPRGRVYLMRAVDEGRLDLLSPTFENHLNRCLGCRACEQVCPSGVEYGHLLEAGRAELWTKKERRGPVGFLLKTVLRRIWIFPGRLRFLFALGRVFRDSKLPALILKTGLLQRLSPRLGFGLALLECSGPRRPKTAPAAKAQTSPEPVEENPKQPALIFRGCVMEGLFGRINDATARVLAVNGFAAEIPADQVCCGALHAHSGDLESARNLARRNIEAFGDGAAPIVTNAGGCGAMLCEYGHLLADDAEFAARAKAFSARVRDVGQALAQTGRPKKGAPSETRVTCDVSCHLQNGQHAGEDSLAMLRAAGVDFVPLNGADVCCGGAGIYNLLEPELSAQILGEKLENIKKTGVGVLATGNPGCHLQIAAGMKQLEKTDLEVCHPVELLDESYRRAGYYSENE